MGSPKSDSMAHKNEFPQHEVSLSPFLIAKYEVTHADWNRIMGEPSRVASKHNGDNIPLEKVRWAEAKKFSETLGLSLPTEAQWEYACRGGASTRFSFGNEVSKFVSYGWHNKNSGSMPHPVGEKSPNGFGIHDMHGNVAEWCDDVWDPHLFKKRKSKQTDPLVTSGSYFRFLRGGAYYDRIERCRSADRSECDDPAIRASGRGFRPVWLFNKRSP